LATVDGGDEAHERKGGKRSEVGGRRSEVGGRRSGTFVGSTSV
jgi:hypothetical protein